MDMREDSQRLHRQRKQRFLPRQSLRRGMRAALFLVLCLFTLPCLFACGGTESGRRKEAEDPVQEGVHRISVVTTVFPAWDFIRQIGGDNVDVRLLLRPGMDSHSFEPTPQDMIAISDSELFVYVGGESEAWVETLLSGAGEVNACPMMGFVQPLEEEHAQGMQVKGHHHGSGEEEYDEHIWTSPVNAMAIVRGLCEKLSEADPARAQLYEANTEAYLEKLGQLDASFRQTVEQGRRRTVVFGDRFPFLYFVREYGLEYAAAFPGCNGETEPNAATVAYLTDKIKQEGIPVVFYLELSSHRVADALAEGTGARTMEFHSCHNVTKEEMEEGATYLSLMEKNRLALEEALR